MALSFNLLYFPVSFSCLTYAAHILQLQLYMVLLQSRIYLSYIFYPSKEHIRLIGIHLSKIYHYFNFSCNIRLALTFLIYHQSQCIHILLAVILTFILPFMAISLPQHILLTRTNNELLSSSLVQTIVKLNNLWCLIF